jgi:uncharacterized membrane-anchored protein YitT (DUF2179 family)
MGLLFRFFNISLGHLSNTALAKHFFGISITFRGNSSSILYRLNEGLKIRITHLLINALYMGFRDYFNRIK